MKGTVKFERKAFSRTEFYGGKYTCDCSQWEDEYQEETYDFIVVKEVDVDNSMVTIAEITWTDKEPENKEEVEKYIHENFLGKTE